MAGEIAGRFRPFRSICRPHGGTAARRRVRAAARRHDGTAARRHDGTVARRLRRSGAPAPVGVRDGQSAS
ncbi:MAG: hypothetical protein IPK72_23420 [Candidatus Eisenbacteria bacterium]|nr:hypothetical protein [Candidatus Eisenbacteria bacterium]